MPKTLKTFPGNKLRGQTHLPGDKSISHRAIILAALGNGQSQIENLLVAGVTQPMLQALDQLGLDTNLEGTTLVVNAAGVEGLRIPNTPIFCGNSATTMRLLAGALAAVGLPAILDGSDGLRRRPMARIVDPLWEMGVPIRARGEGGTAPLDLAPRVTDRSLRGIKHHPPVASAQVKTCLLLAGLAADDTVTIHEPAPSRDHTERLFASLGLNIERLENPDGTVTVSLHPADEWELPPLQLALPGDISSAAFLIVAALTTPGSAITLRDVGLNPTRTGLLDALQAMDANLEVQPRGERHGEPVGDITARYSKLQGTEIADPLVVRMIDEMPIFALAAAHAQGQTLVRDAEELRHKESDRITALCAELQTLGVNIAETPDGFTIQGGTSLTGGTVQSHGDHRLAMTLAIAGLNAQSPVTVHEADIITESFPNFAATLRSLGASLAGKE
ncbi:MAG: 3-phosphoshikimate 1-carboxyvinyltransferase [Chloroflexi bacterium]|nr:3-phosphoshikimate 1-carboxyvinyltransferase [Chloroflexota bacterium]